MCHFFPQQSTDTDAHYYYLKYFIIIIVSNPDASVIHASGLGQLLATQPLAGPRPIHRAVTTTESNDMVVGEDHMMGPSCQQYNWLTVRWGSIALTAQLGVGKLLLETSEVLTKYPLMNKISEDNLMKKSGVKPLKVMWCENLAYLRQLP